MKQEYSLQAWFNKLLAYEKCIILTIIDPELVKLIKAMHSKYDEFGHGTFSSTWPNEISNYPRESDNYSRVDNYQLLFKQPESSGPSVGFS
jgi:hypothetical protein